MRWTLRLLLVCLAAFGAAATAAPVREPAGLATGAAPPRAEAQAAPRPARASAVRAPIASESRPEQAEVAPRARRFLWHRALLR